MDLAQSIVYPSTDTSLLLVANKDVLVLVNATTTSTTEGKPVALLKVQGADGGVVAEIVMTQPTQALPSTVSDVPGFARQYSAVVPATHVKTGMRLVASIDNGKTPLAVQPKVGAANPITFVAVPVRIGTLTGQVYADSAAYIQAHAPVSTVTMRTRAVYTSQRVTVLPTTSDGWSTAFGNLLEEIADLHAMEGANNRTYYYGFIPKRTYGLAGLGYMPGTAAIGFDIAGPAAGTMMHELGHNFRLPHAPCGVDSASDPEYPYANGLLGAPGRYRWGYDATTKTFIDARKTTEHDLMSYCSGSIFSDFNYRRVQGHLTPADKAQTTSGALSVQAPQELLYVRGRITARGAELRPFKSFSGTPNGASSGAYRLRLVTDQGTVEQRFDTQAVDHGPDLGSFSFSIPHPGRITQATVLRDDGAVLLDQAAAPTASTERVQALSSSPRVDASEDSGTLRLRWNATTHPYLTVIHVGATRTVLTQDATGGDTRLGIAELPAGGRYEFTLSDGLNTVRVNQVR